MRYELCAPRKTGAGSLLDPSLVAGNPGARAVSAALSGSISKGKLETDQVRSFKVPVELSVQSEYGPKLGKVPLARLALIVLVTPDGLGRDPHRLCDLVLQQPAPRPVVLQPAAEGVPGVQEVLGVSLRFRKNFPQPALDLRDDPAENPGF